jgi:hypothetical protein
MTSFPPRRNFQSRDGEISVRRAKKKSARVAEALEEGLMQARFHFGRQRDGFGIAVDLDCFARCIHDQPAFFAAIEMTFEIGGGHGVQRLVQVAR